MIFDIETTGLDVSDGHRVIEIGCVEINNRIITDRYLHLYINPHREIDVGALSVHGLTSEFLSDKPDFADVITQFLDFINDAEIIAHNAQFDVKFINSELDKLNLGNLSKYCRKITDSLSLARKIRPGKRNSLDALCDHYGISNLDRKMHGALLDSRLLSQVWLAMTRGQNEFLIDDYERNKKSFQITDNHAKISLPVIIPKEEEINSHQEYLRNMKKESSNSVLWIELDRKNLKNSK
ncbi:DNA polymerase III subunit epsilon [Candidatus Kinetoplastibacterium crithidii (ex Angomonas deanei ATCC 30255)]|nr:DNA polymerase III subunit epsilon [Candidatus Kinetoplastibacterium crithidii (ex Angomonas deanei ATCC 30255)]